MPELQHIRRGLFEAGFHEFTRNRFRRIVGSDGVEHNAEFDVFRSHGRRGANITVGVGHQQLAMCLASVCAELNEPGRARLFRTGFAWLLARSVTTMEVEQIDMATRYQTWAVSYSIGDMVRHVEPACSIASIVEIIASDTARWRGWFKPGSLLGMKTLIALELLKRRGAMVEPSASALAMGWIMNDPRYAPLGPDQFLRVVEQAVSRNSR